ncbi:hypothetical protein TIFTF001_032060 [Ficus carica]|uniref:Uncharacterized protein n=1 Tax=Ficus carica TaxID=3494 RepID=A0AA88J582_FICCA|nr:hypothetical protein TIFTF001_032060 [Ficus carica]
MVRQRRIVPLNPPEPDIANVVTNLQRQLLEQQQETNRLREQIARMNQMPQANEVPPQAHQVPPGAPQVPEVQPEIPRNVEVPLAPAGVQVNPPLVWEDLLAGEGSLCFLCAKKGCKTLVDDSPDAQRCHGYELLARLCPELVPSETEKVRRMMKIFRTDIAKQVSAGSSPPTLVSDCISPAIRAEYWIN